MKKIKLLLICLLSALASRAQFGMPSFKEVVTTFYSKYSFDISESYLKFQRKKEGWFVSQSNYDNSGNYFNSLLFWSNETRSYRNIDYPLSNDDTSAIAENVNKYLKLIDWDYEEYQFKRNKYYGYPGWDWDVIKADTAQNNQNDSLLESNARAYSNYASGFIAEQFGDLFLNDDTDRIPLKANDKIAGSRINKFVLYELKAVEAYSKILNINPDYVTKIGKIKIKLANEYMFMYLDLLMAGDSFHAKEFAKKGDYPDSIIALSKSYLKPLPLNSILITSGDNDTYPLWYLQVIQNYRPDVIVLNFSLLGFRRYISLIDQKYRHSLFSTRDTTYLKNNFEYSVFSNPQNDNHRIDVGIFLTDLTQGRNPYDMNDVNYKGENLKKYYSKKLFFTRNGKRTAFITLRDYLFMNEYVLLDIINTSNNRKIFFTYPFEILSTIMRQKGRLFEIEL